MSAHAHALHSFPDSSRTVARSLQPRAVSTSIATLSPDSFNELTPTWTSAVSSGESAEPFLQPYWFSLFAQTFGQDRHISSVVAKDGERVIGALPLMRQRTFCGGLPARTLHSLSNLHSCRFDMGFADTDKETAAEHIWRALRDDDSWDVVEALHVPKGGGFEAIMKRAAYDGFLIGKWPTLLSPYMVIPHAVSDVFAGCPAEFAGFRKTHLKSFRKLEKLGKVTFSSVTEFDQGFLDRFIELEGAGWKRRSGGAIVCDPTVERFYRTALQAAGDAGHFRSHCLALNGRPIAMDLGLIMNGRYYSPKIAYDESMAKYAPGQQLIRLTIQHLAEMGATRYDFVGPRSHHKAFWTDTVREHATCYIFRANWSGFARYLAAMKVGTGLRRLKRWRYGDPQALPKK